MGVDWAGMFVPKMSLVELALRGTFMYLSLFAVLRVLVRRHAGSMSLMDLLLMVVIADAAQNAMAGEYNTVTEGVVLCGTIIGWNYFLDWLAYRYPSMRRWLEPPPLILVQDGVILRRNLRQELISEEELRSLLRVHGVEDVGLVRVANIEPDGALSVFLKEDGGAGSAKGEETNSNSPL